MISIRRQKNLGNIVEDLDFNYGKGTSVSASCTATLNGDVWIFGGDALGEFNPETQVGTSQS